MLQSLKAYFMARQEVKHAKICSTKRMRADHKSSKNFLRHAKAPKSQSLFYGEIESQACQDLLDQAKASRPQKFQKISKACNGSKVSKPLRWRDRKPSVSGSARPSEGEQTTESSKTFLRRAKAPKSQSIFYGEIGSQAWQDLLDQAKACRPQKFQKISKACKVSKVSKLIRWRDWKPSMPGSARPSEGEQTTKSSKTFLTRAKAPKSQSLFDGETGSQACQVLLNQAKASRSLKVLKNF